ncbi:hypothetical protein QP572_08955 [Brevibacterium sp. UMB10442]|nr:hypothetical protein [Brevibacterium sp. UMB10442]
MSSFIQGSVVGVRCWAVQGAGAAGDGAGAGDGDGGRATPRPARLARDTSARDTSAQHAYSKDSVSEGLLRWHCTLKHVG